MERDHFKTITSEGKGLFKEKGSKFISYAYYVENEDEIKNKLDFLRKKYHDARHHCYAWRLGADMRNFRANDDGEPSNSAGKPILGQIESKNLSNVLVVVIRYFGGTLLGVGGLIQAYKKSAKAALEDTKIKTQYVLRNYHIEFPYEQMNIVMKVLKDLKVEPFDQSFELNCSLKVKVEKNQSGKLEKSFELETDIQLSCLGEK
jgi:uncharacterized YigZ family protein